MSLFRPEALADSRHRIKGRVVLVSPLSLTLLSALAALIVVACGGFLVLADYSRRETVGGVVSPVGGLAKVVASAGGTIDALYVAEGQDVVAGQVIAVIRTAPVLASGDTAKTLLTGVSQEGEAEAARHAAALQLVSDERIRLDRKGAGLERAIHEARARITNQGEQVTLAKAELKRGEEIAARGFLTRRELDSRRASLLATEARLSELKMELFALQRERSDVTMQLQSLASQQRDLNAQSQASKALLAQKQTELAMRSTYNVVAPIAGRIAALPINGGQYLAPGATVAALNPKGSMLEAQLYLPSKAVGFVKPGQPVELKYQSFPDEKHGPGRGVVVAVAQTALSSDELAPLGAAPAEPSFRARVKLLDDHVAAYGRREPLRPGMLLTADIIVDRRSLAEWLLDPIHAADH